MGTLFGALGRIVPFAIIAGLLAAALLIEPKATGLLLPESLIGPRDRFYGVATAGGSAIWLAGSNGKILRSDDGGTSWRAQKPGTDLHIQDIAAWDRDRAIAVGNSGLILVTNDGGAIWQRVEPKIEGLFLDKLLRVNTRDGGRVSAVGEFGAVMASDDYGRTWRLTTEQGDVGLNDIAFASDTAAWVVGEFGTMLRSGDEKAGDKNDEFRNVDLANPPYWNPDDDWEPREVWVIEATTPPEHPYSKKILYMETKFPRIYFTEVYDRKGQFWKFLNFLLRPHKGADGLDTVISAQGHTIDFQRNHATVFISHPSWKTNTPEGPMAVTLGVLEKEAGR